MAYNSIVYGYHLYFMQNKNERAAKLNKAIEHIETLVILSKLTTPGIRLVYRRMVW